MDNLTIADAQSDQEVLELLSKELNERVPAALQGDLDGFLAQLKTLPAGLRAMAATYQLDVSIALDDLGWHFANWHHHGYSLETARGLRELGAARPADLFEAAYAHALRYWDQLAAEGFVEWYHGSELEAVLEPLNREMWTLYAATGDSGLMKFWVNYARRNPNLLREERAAP